jgi:hypothetical protein
MWIVCILTRKITPNIEGQAESNECTFGNLKAAIAMSLNRVLLQDAGNALS